MSLEPIALIYEHATHTRMWLTNDALLDIGSLKKNQLQAIFLSAHRHSQLIAVGLWITNGIFENKGIINGPSPP